jgi:hypothetical protein
MLVISAGLLCPKTARTPPCLQCLAIVPKHSPDKQEHPTLPTRVCRREGLRGEDRMTESCSTLKGNKIRTSR